ncbi:MAG: MFS transporter, partial [Chloroflexi bacterium]|nr:MFS transporter [Chloroflexota bacterium]
GVFFTSVIIFQLAHSAVVSPWQPLYPDIVPKHQRGNAAGIRSLADILGLIIGRKFAGDILAQFDLLGQPALFRTIAIPSVALVLALIIIIWSLRNHHTSDTSKRPRVFSWRDIYLVDFKSHPAFAWWFVNRFFFWAAFTSLATFLLFFAIDVIGLPQGIAQGYLGNLALILGSAILMITLFAGWLADKVGRKPLVIAAGLLAALGSIIVMFARDLILLAVAGTIIGTAAAVFISANFALITDIVPRKEAARYLGVALIASASGGAIARLIGALLVDPVNNYYDSNSIGYMALYGTASILFIISSLAALRLPIPKPDNSSKP